MSTDFIGLAAQQLKSEFQRAQDEAVPSAGDLERAAKQLRAEQDAARLRQSAAQTGGINPDQAAQAQRMARQSGLPEGVVERNPDEVAKRLRLQELDQVAQDPAMAAFFSDPSNLKVASDDLLTLRDIADVARSLPAGAVKSAGSMLTGAGEDWEAMGRTILRPADMVLGALGLGKSEDYSPQMPWWLAPGEILKRPGNVAKVVGKGIAAPADRQNFATDVAEGLGQIAQQIAVMMMTGGTVGTAMLFAQGADQQAEKQERAGAKGTAEGDAAIFAGGAVTAITERYGLDLILRKLPEAARTQITRKLIDIAVVGGANAVQELVEGVLQNVVEYAFYNPEAEIFEDFSREALAAGGAAGIMRAIILSAAGGKGAARARQQTEKATKDAEALKTINQLAEQSKLRERSPDKFRQFIVGLIEQDRAVELDAQTATTLFQEVPDLAQFMTPAEVERLTQAIAVAQQTGADVRMPLATFVKAFVGTQSFDELAENVRMAEDAPTAREASEWSDAEAMDQLSRLRDELGEVVSKQDQIQNIYDDVFAQLKAAAVDDVAATKYAAIVTARLRTRAERLGRDPGELWMEQRPLIRRQMDMQGQAFDELDVTLDDLRSKQKIPERAAYGDSLIEFLAGRGGLIDAGGELKAMDADKWHRERRGRKKLVVEGGGGPTGPNMLGMSGGEKNRLSLDEAARAAWEAGYFPELTDRPTPDDLLAAIERELKGGTVYAPRNRNDALAGRLEAAQQLDEVMQRLGLDPATATPAEIREAVDRYAREEATAPDAEGDGRTLEQPAAIERLQMVAGRGQRAMASRASISKEERAAIAASAKATGVSEKEILAAVRTHKLAHPTAQGWARLVYSRTVVNDGKVQHEYRNIPYGFSSDAKGAQLEPGSAPYNRRVAAIASAMVQEVRAVFRRAIAGDANARNILAQAGWYKAMRARLRKEFGGLGDLFADLLGATSPNTPVRDNWFNGVDALRRALRGDFDDLIDKWDAHFEHIDALESDMRAWVNERLAEGQTKKAVKSLPEYETKLADLREARRFPDELLPTKESGAKYGFNGRNVARAMVDLWRVVKNADPDIARSGTAPKALNFSGNLIGFRNRATIDVWAARMLQRLAGGKRIPSMAEATVSGEMRQDSSTTLQFGFGQDVFARASAAIRSDAEMQADATLAKINDDDLQAVVWFIEKELWTVNDWTNAAGEGGSFELEANLTGSSDQKRIKELRSIIDAAPPSADVKAAAEDTSAARQEIEAHERQHEAEIAELKRLISGEIAAYKGSKRRIAELQRIVRPPAKAVRAIAAVARAKARLEDFGARKVAAKAELALMEREVDRYVGGLSIQMSRDTQGVDYVPTDADMARLAEDIRRAIYEADDGATVLGSKSLSTEGRYGSVERALDLEVVAREGYDANALWLEMLRQAQAARQDATFLSRVLRDGEAVDPLRHRPGVEIYFRSAAAQADLEKLLADLAGQGVEFLTVVVDARRLAEARSGAMPAAVGVRLLYVPEFEQRYGIDDLVGLDDAALAERVSAKQRELSAIAARVAGSIDGVAFAGQFWYETQVAFSSQYQEKIDALATGAAQAVGGATGAAVWVGEPIRSGLEGADRHAGEAASGQSDGQLLGGDAQRADAADGQEGAGLGRTDGRTFEQPERTPRQGGRFSAVERALEDLAADIDGWREGEFDEVMARKALDRLSDRDREDPRARLLDRALLWLDGTIELDQDAVADEIDQVLTRARQIDEMMAGMRSAADTGRTVEQPALPDTLDVDGVARPTTNSKGQPIAQTEEGVRAFWRWFGDSKVVDSEGRPLVVYRGQRRVAKPERFIMTRGRATPSFVEDPQVASVYSRQLDTLQFGAGSNVMPVYLRIVSMLDMRKSGRETTLEGVLHGLNYDWSVEYGRSREGSEQTDGDVSFEEFKAARRQASIGYGDLADALRDLDELIYKTGANYEIEASDGQGFRIKSFSDLADQIEQMGADGDTTGIDIAISEAVIDAYTVADSEAFVDLLTRLGFDGIIVSDVFDAGARFYEGDAALIEGDEDGQATVSTYRPFGQNQIKSATGNRGTFDPENPSILEQVEGKTPRGSIKFLPGGRTIITLTEKADLSTFLHELSHGWLEEMKADAQAPGAPADIRADWERIAKYLGIDPAIDEIPTEAHETFARTGEAYFMEGKAPSTDLAGAFARFKAWLVRIYRTIRELRVPINDDIRGVFDRMLATDEEIAAVRGQYRFDALFDAPAAQGMTKAEFRAYRDLAAKAQLEAEAEVAAALQADAEREQTEQYREAREAIANEVEAQVRAEPVQRAIVFLRDGTLPDGTKTDAPIKLARGPLRETYGRKAVKRLPKGVTADDGVPADMVATLFGFQSGDELVKALMAAPPVEGEIRRRLEARLREQFPDARKDGRAHEAAIEAMHGDARMRVLEAEFRALKRLGAGEIVEAAVRRKMAGKAAPTEADVTAQATTQAESEAIRMEPGVGPEGRADAAMGRARTAATRTVAKQQRTDQAAARKIAVDTLSVDREAIERAVDAINGETKVSDMLNAQRWRRAEKAAADAVVDAVASRNWGAAAWHQRQRIIAAHMVRRSAEARKDIEKAIERFNKYLSRKPGAIDPDYLDKVRAILQAYQFGPQLSDRRRAILEMRQIARWQAALAEDEQARLEIAPEILAADEKTHYRDMTLDEFMALRDTVENLATIGRTKTRLLRNQAERDLNRTAELVSETILTNVKTKARRSRDAIEKGVGYGIEKFKDQFFASHRKIENLVRELDGFANLGPVWQALFKPLQDAQNEETRMSIEAAAAIKKLFERFPEDGRRTWRTRTTYYPSVNQSLSKATVISIALNWGNEGNREAIRKGFRWSDQQVQELFDAALTAEDAAFVQSVWDYIDTFWPALSALEKRVKGISPAKVEASPLQIAGVDLSGGYYPLKYDPDLSERAYAHQVDKLAQNLMSGAVAKASTRTGAAIERVGSGGMPVRLELDVMFEHVAELIHDISHREAILDVARLLDHPSVKGAVLDTKGPQFHRAMKDWVRDVAAGDVPALTWFDKIVQHLRSGMSISAMGWKLTTAMVQPTGFFQSAAALPKGVLGKHVAAFYGAPLAMKAKVDFVYERSVEMRTRSKSLDRDIRDTLRRLGPEGKVDAVKRSFFYLTGMMDMGVAVPTWLAAYEVGMEQFAGDEAKAIDYADQLVRTTQSSGLQKDLAAIQRGDPRMKMFTAFYSYFSATYNLMADNARQVRRPADMPKFVANMVLLTLLPAVASELMMGRGPGDDDREEPLGWAKWMAATTLKYALSGFVGVRDVVNALGSNFGYAGSPVGSAVEQFVQLGKEIGQGEADRGLAKAAVNAAGPILHLPSRQAWITAEGIYLWAEGADITPFEMFVTRDPAKFR